MSLSAPARAALQWSQKDYDAFAKSHNWQTETERAHESALSTNENPPSDDFFHWLEGALKRYDPTSMRLKDYNVENFTATHCGSDFIPAHCGLCDPVNIPKHVPPTQPKWKTGHPLLHEPTMTNPCDRFMHTTFLHRMQAVDWDYILHNDE